jgi:SAM-dependent methyltransferase
MSLRIALKSLEAAIRDPRQFSVPRSDRECPICGFTGRFHAVGTPPRWDGRCPSCGSRERHRLFQLYLNQLGTSLNDFGKILHVAPERHVRRMLADHPGYFSADIVEGKADLKMDIADLRFQDGELDMIIANHVLEHVPDDHRAMAEIGRCLSPRGIAVLTVPQVWSRPTTYENTQLGSQQERYAHYQDADHLRYYGADFDQVLARASGLEVEVWRMPQEEEARYGLYRDDVLFIGRKPSAG